MELMELIGDESILLTGNRTYIPRLCFRRRHDLVPLGCILGLLLAHLHQAELSTRSVLSRDAPTIALSMCVALRVHEFTEWWSVTCMDGSAALCGSVAVGALNERQAIGMSRHVSQHHGTALLFPQFQDRERMITEITRVMPAA
jgi:hypothetical protein